MPPASLKKERKQQQEDTQTDTDTHRHTRVHATSSNAAMKDKHTRGSGGDQGLDKRFGAVLLVGWLVVGAEVFCNEADLPIALALK